jgi:hypothetical protein
MPADWKRRPTAILGADMARQVKIPPLVNRPR